MLMTRPSRWPRKVGSVARITLWTPKRFTSNRSRSCSGVKLSETPAEATPALLMTTSSLPPDVASSVAIASSTSALLVTSRANTFTPSRRSVSAGARLRPDKSRTPPKTEWPARAKVSAISRPKPLEAPVIRIVLRLLLILSPFRHPFDTSGRGCPCHLELSTAAIPLKPPGGEIPSTEPLRPFPAGPGNFRAAGSSHRQVRGVSFQDACPLWQECSIPQDTSFQLLGKSSRFLKLNLAHRGLMSAFLAGD